MNFVKIRYEGRAPYKDRTALKNTWEPGDTKLVSERDAELLGYLEFKRVVADTAAKESAEPTSGDDELKQAQQAQAEAIALEKQASKLTEDTLMEVARMSKGELGEFAKQNYGVDLSQKDKLDDLRNQVTALVQGGLN